MNFRTDTKLPFPLWYVAEFPIKDLVFDPKDYDPRRTEWYGPLKADIKKRGLMSPITVQNHNKVNNLIRVGRNRVSIAIDLGWETIPAIVTGKVDPALNGVFCETLIDARKYMGDGLLICIGSKDVWNLHVADATKPTNYRYPE